MIRDKACTVTGGFWLSCQRAAVAVAAAATEELMKRY